MLMNKLTMKEFNVSEHLKQNFAIICWTDFKESIVGLKGQSQLPVYAEMSWVMCSSWSCEFASCIASLVTIDNGPFLPVKFN